MGYDATSGERNTTGQPRQTQALSFAGSTAKPHKASIMEELTYISRMWAHAPYPLNWEIAISTFIPNRPPLDGRWSLSGQVQVQPGRGRQSRTHGCCVPWLAVPADNLRSASWYSPSRARSRPEIPLLWFICSKTESPFGSPRPTRASPAAVAKL